MLIGVGFVFVEITFTSPVVAVRKSQFGSKPIEQIKQKVVVSKSLFELKVYQLIDGKLKSPLMISESTLRACISV